MPLLAPGLGPLGVPELLIIAFIVVLIFGVGRLPEVGGAVGKSIREFRKSTRDDDDGIPDTAAGSTLSSASAPAAPAPTTGTASAPPVAPPSAPAAATDDTRFCSECGARNARTAKYCAECGNAMQAAAR